MNYPCMPLHVKMLNEEFERRQKQRAQYSMKKFAGDLGVGPTLLETVLAGSGAVSLRAYRRLLARFARNMNDAEIGPFISSVIEINAHYMAQKLAMAVRNPTS